MSSAAGIPALRTAGAVSGFVGLIAIIFGVIFSESEVEVGALFGGTVVLNFSVG